MEANVEEITWKMPIEGPVNRLAPFIATHFVEPWYCENSIDIFEELFISDDLSVSHRSHLLMVLISPDSHLSMLEALSDVFKPWEWPFGH